MSFILGIFMLQIQLELDRTSVDKLAYIQQQTNQPNISELLKAAIDLYHQTLCQRSSTPLEALMQTGFIGCGETEPD